MTTPARVAPWLAALLSWALAACAEPLSLSTSSDSSGSEGGRSIWEPMPSVGRDPAPFRLERQIPPEQAPKARPQRPVVYRFEREPSGTTEALRAVIMSRSAEPSKKIPIAIGDRGTALRRDPVKGWVRE